MPYNPDAHHRRSIRLRGYDYAQPGAYFITICTYQRQLLFDHTEAASAVHATWDRLPIRFPALALDAFVVMPNHVHGILVVAPHDVGAVHELPLPTTATRRRTMLLPMAVGYFKMNSAKRINLLRNTPGLPVWQRNYYEHVIRSDDALNRIRQYILDNPARWGNDRDNPFGQPDRYETTFWETLEP